MGAAKRRTFGVTLRGPKVEEEDVPKPKLVAFRCPPDLQDYLRTTAASVEGQDQTGVIIDALRLDKDLGLKLNDDRSRLDTYAKSLGLSMYRDLAEIISRLVRKGLDAEGAVPQRGKKK
jgi:hypothetical protein